MLSKNPAPHQVTESTDDKVRSCGDKVRSDHSDFENMLFERVVEKSQSDEIIDKEILDLALDDHDEDDYSDTPENPPGHQRVMSNEQMDQEAQLEMKLHQVEIRTTSA